jgi:site-specific recombinase XerD
MQDATYLSTTKQVGHITTLAKSFRRSLLSENKAPRTIETYTDAVELLGDFLDRMGMPTNVSALRREHIEAFIAELLTRNKPATASNRYRALQVFFRWLSDEGKSASRQCAICVRRLSQRPLSRCCQTMRSSGY